MASNRKPNIFFEKLNSKINIIKKSKITTVETPEKINIEEIQNTEPFLIEVLKAFYKSEYVYKSEHVNPLILQRNFKLDYSEAEKIISKLTSYGYIKNVDDYRRRILVLTEEEIKFILNLQQESIIKYTDIENNTVLLSEPLVFEVLKYFTINHIAISVYAIQRKFKLGNSHANKIFNELEEKGFIKKDNSNEYTKMIISNSDLEQIKFVFNSQQENNPDIKSEDTNSSHSLSEPPAISDILRYIDTMTVDGVRFENLCCLLLKDNGFSDIKTTRTSGDYGVDILAKKDGITYAIQCKCYSDKVGNKAVQEAFSGKSYYNCMVAAVLTNNYFTKAAEETAKANNVLLWDRNKLAEFLKVLNSSKNENDIHNHNRDKARSAFANQLEKLANTIFSLFAKNNILLCRMNDIDIQNNGAYFFIQLRSNDDLIKVESSIPEIAEIIHSNYVAIKETNKLPEICLFVEFPENLKILYNEYIDSIRK